MVIAISILKNLIKPYELIAPEELERITGEVKQVKINRKWLDTEAIPREAVGPVATVWGVLFVLGAEEGAGVLRRLAGAEAGGGAFDKDI